MYLLMVVEKKQSVDVLGKPVPINLVWADGMVGACPLFNTREAAEKYRGKNINIPIYEVGEVGNG